MSMTKAEQEAAVVQAADSYNKARQSASVVHMVARHNAKEAFITEIERVLSQPVVEMAAAMIEHADADGEVAISPPA